MGNYFGSSQSKDDNLETFHLVWLDTAANDTKEDEESRQLLRTSINHLRIFNDKQECENYIQKVSKNDRIVFIVTGQLDQEMLPSIHQLRQISSIYIYCMNKDYHEEWSREFSKVRGVIVDLEDLVAKIRSDQLIRSRNKVDEPLSISIFDPNIDKRQWTIGSNTQFIYSLFLIDYFLLMKPTDKDKTNLVALCQKEYANNEPELAVVREFQQNYQPQRALWWYTRDSFLSRLLSKSLRVQDTNLLLLFRFFMHDINQLLNKYQCTSTIFVYRSQLMSNEELQIFKDSIGKFIVMDSFLSTILNRDQAINFVKTLLPGNELKQTLFEIEADPQFATSKPFANITAYSYYANEEILFMVGSIFKLIDIHCDDNQIWIIRMKLCDENDQNLKTTFDYIKVDETKEENLLTFIHILRRLGKTDEAKTYCLRLVDELPRDHSDLPACYEVLGIIANEKNDLNESLKWHNASLSSATRNLKSNNPRLTSNYTSIAAVHRQKGDYKQALTFYNKALTIAKEAFGDVHINVAECYTNIGNVYQADKQYFEALDHYLRALVIRQKQSSSYHTQTGTLLNSMADCYVNLGLFDLALAYHDQSMEIFKKSNLPQNRNLASTFHSKGIAYEKKNDLQQALLSYKEAVNIYRHALSATHPTLIQIEQDIQRVNSLLQ